MRKFFFLISTFTVIIFLSFGEKQSAQELIRPPKKPNIVIVPAAGPIFDIESTWKSEKAEKNK